MWLMDCIRRRCLFLAEEVEPPLAKPPEMVLMVPRKGGGGGAGGGVGRGDVGAGGLWVLIVGLGGVVVVM